MKDSSRESEAAELLKLTSSDMLQFGIVDKVIKEFSLPQEDGMEKVIEDLDSHLCLKLSEYDKIDSDTISKARYEKFRTIDRYAKNMIASKISVEI